MKKILLLFALLNCALSCSSSANKQDVDLSVKVLQNNGGIMLNGWGNIEYSFTNNTAEEITVNSVSGAWNAGGERYNNWGEGKDLKLAPNSNGKFIVTTWMPPKTKELANGATPFVDGKIKYIVGEKKDSLNYKVDVAIAVLPSPTKLIKGKYAGVELQETTWEKVNDPKKITKYIDETYKHMMELTSNTPYNGDLMVLLEAPENPYYAYAGNPIIMNTSFVANAAKTFDNDFVEFGWVHEMGHDFDDVIGNWYNWGTFTEFQANIKLSYVVENMCKGNSKYKIKSWVDKKTSLNGVEFNDEFFAPYSKKYLASDKSWTSMISDDYHSLFLTVIRREKSWNVMKKFYSTFGELSKRSQAYPQGEERVLLALSVFSKCAKKSLAPLYAEYRIPLTDSKMKEILKKYDI